MSAPGHYPHECEFIPKRGAADEDAGYLASRRYDDSSRGAANLIVIDAQRFRDDPVVVIELPMHVPYTFHGAFVPK